MNEYIYKGKIIKYGLTPMGDALLIYNNKQKIVPRSLFENVMFSFLDQVCEEMIR